MRVILYLALCLVLMPAQGVIGAPVVSRVWTRPEAPVRGNTLEWAILGSGFDDSVSVLTFGPGCDKGCPLQLDVKKSDLLSGSFKVTGIGKFSVKVQTRDGGASEPKLFFFSSPLSITRVWTKPDPPLLGQPFEIGIEGSGFDPASIQAALQCSPSNCVVTLASRTSGMIAGRAPAMRAGQHRVMVRNAADSQLAETVLTIPNPVISNFSVNPNPPTRNVPFNFVLSGTYLGAAPEIRLYAPGCEQGCRPNSIKITRYDSTTIVGVMSTTLFGIVQIGVVSADSRSANFFPVTIR